MNACARIPHPLGELISTLNVGFNALISFSGLLHFQPLAQKSSTVMQSKDGFSDRRTAALGRNQPVATGRKRPKAHDLNSVECSVPPVDYL